MNDVGGQGMGRESREVVNEDSTQKWHGKRDGMREDLEGRVSEKNGGGGGKKVCNRADR